jgi:poly(glycerol-phosphate) alpha-glucosyltransferase
MRIGLLTASASRLGGGVFEAVVAHATMIRQLGAVPVVIALEDGFSNEDRTRFDGSGAEVVVCRVAGPRQIGYSPGMLAALEQARLDCLHLHGIWMYPSHAGARWARKTGQPYFISPHGMLDPWIVSRGRWKKALARLGYERAGWARATAMHALTRREARDIVREVGEDKSLVIPNAGPAAALEAPLPPADRHVVYIGRIHAKKNLIALVAGWAAAERPARARLTIAGWGDDADVAALKQAIAAADGSVAFVGPVFGQQKQALLDDARFVVLTSHSEGLPMAILEAWAAGKPTLMTAECNLEEGFAAGAALECGYDQPAIAQTVQQALAMDDAEWQRMSAAALALARSSFSSEVVAKQWGQAYAAAIHGGSPRQGDRA